MTETREVNDFNELIRIDGSATAKRRVEYIFSNGEKYELDGVQDFFDNKVNINGFSEVTVHASVQTFCDVF